MASSEANEGREGNGHPVFFQRKRGMLEQLEVHLYIEECLKNDLNPELGVLRSKSHDGFLNIPILLLLGDIVEDSC